jgi:hypothetical protein
LDHRQRVPDKVLMMNVRKVSDGNVHTVTAQLLAEPGITAASSLPPGNGPPPALAEDLAFLILATAERMDLRLEVLISPAEFCRRVAKKGLCFRTRRSLHPRLPRQKSVRSRLIEEKQLLSAGSLTTRREHEDGSRAFHRWPMLGPRDIVTNTLAHGQ